MSFFTNEGRAICSIAGIDEAGELAMAVYDYLVNHPDEIPAALDGDDDDSDAAFLKIASYLSFDGTGRLVISLDDDGDLDLWTFLTRHVACLQTSLYMSCHWRTHDSREGSDFGSFYLDRQGEEINLNRALEAYLLG